VPEFSSVKSLTLQSSIKLNLIRVKDKGYDSLNPMWNSRTVSIQYIRSLTATNMTLAVDFALHRNCICPLGLAL
jgi:hypothetical protein